MINDEPGSRVWGSSLFHFSYFSCCFRRCVALFFLSAPPPPGTIGRAGGATCDENKSFQRRSRFPQESPRRNGGKELGGKVEHDGGGILKMKQKEEEWEELR